MTRRTLFEWKALPYGEGEDCIPEKLADRLAAVASASPLGGERGGRILSHGRTQIRAGQVVGVLVAPDCELEILPKIDFESGGATSVGQTRKQLVHMLAEALDMDVAAGSISDLGWQKESLLEILIRLFSLKLSDALRQGLPRNYTSCEDDLPVLRGSLDVTRQFTVLAANASKLACKFDVLSPDIALNRIMKAAVERLLRVSRSTDNQRRLRELAFHYADIAPLPVASLRWDSLSLDRTNSRWRELLNLARLLLGERFQTTSLGDARGFSLLFEMNTLFEEYIAKMLRRALADTDLTVHSQAGRLFCLEDTADGATRFMTKPDLLVKRNGSVELIIDTKWKRLTRRLDDPKRGVSQSDVYQMMAYGQVYRCEQLMLLYPHHAGLDPEAGEVSRHRVIGSAGQLITATVDVSKRHGVVKGLLGLRAVSDAKRPPIDGFVSAS